MDGRGDLKRAAEAVQADQDAAEAEQLRAEKSEIKHALEDPEPEMSDAAAEPPTNDDDSKAKLLAAAANANTAAEAAAQLEAEEAGSGSESGSGSSSSSGSESGSGSGSGSESESGLEEEKAYREKREAQKRLLLNVARKEEAEFEEVEAEQKLAEEEGEMIEHDNDQTLNLRKVSTDQRLALLNMAVGQNEAAESDPSAPVEGTKHDQQLRLLDLAIDQGLEKDANEPIGIDATGEHADTPVSAEEITDVSTVAIRSASYMKANSGKLDKPVEAPRRADAPGATGGAKANIEAVMAKSERGCCVIS